MPDLKALKSSIEHETCPEHGKHPEVTIMSNDWLKIQGCCAVFTELIHAKYNAQLRDLVVSTGDPLVQYP